MFTKTHPTGQFDILSRHDGDRYVCMDVASRASPCRVFGLHVSEKGRDGSNNVLHGDRSLFPFSSALPYQYRHQRRLCAIGASNPAMDERACCRDFRQQAGWVCVAWIGGTRAKESSRAASICACRLYCASRCTTKMIINSMVRVKRTCCMLTFFGSIL